MGDQRLRNGATVPSGSITGKRQGLRRGGGQVGGGGIKQLGHAWCGQLGEQGKAVDTHKSKGLCLGVDLAPSNSACIAALRDTPVVQVANGVSRSGRWGPNQPDLQRWWSTGVQHLLRLIGDRWQQHDAAYLWEDSRGHHPATSMVIGCGSDKGRQRQQQH